MSDSVTTWQRNDGTYFAWVGEHKGECPNGMVGCALFDVFERTRHIHDGCKGPLSSKQQVENDWKFVQIERVLDGKTTVDELEHNGTDDMTIEETEEFLHSKPSFSFLRRLLGR